jgi:cell shape-determining protein MreC
MVHVRTILTALLTVGFLSSFTSAAASQTLSEDEKLLATYRLTMPNVKKAMAVVQSVAAELAKDPKVQEHTKLKKELQTLEKKDELTEAEEAQAEKLRERIEVLERERDSRDDSSTFSNAQSIAPSRRPASRPVSIP